MSAAERGGWLAASLLVLIVVLAVGGLVVWFRQPTEKRWRSAAPPGVFEAEGVVDRAVNRLLASLARVLLWLIRTAGWAALGFVIWLVLAAVLKWAWRTVFG